LERRLAAILAADVVGYTRLMGADEAGTLRRVTELRQQVLEPLIAELIPKGVDIDPFHRPLVLVVAGPRERSVHASLIPT
jgi:hypothetical protein